MTKAICFRRTSSSGMELAGSAICILVLMVLIQNVAPGGLAVLKNWTVPTVCWATWAFFAAFVRD